MTDQETKIRENAYYLWEQEGRPEGRSHVHWEMAQKALFGGATPDADARDDGAGNVHNLKAESKPKPRSKAKAAAKPAPKPKRRTKS